MDFKNSNRLNKTVAYILIIAILAQNAAWADNTDQNKSFISMTDPLSVILPSDQGCPGLSGTTGDGTTVCLFNVTNSNPPLSLSADVPDGTHNRYPFVTELAAIVATQGTDDDQAKHLCGDTPGWKPYLSESGEMLFTTAPRWLLECGPYNRDTIYDSRAVRNFDPSVGRTFASFYPSGLPTSGNFNWSPDGKSTEMKLDIKSYDACMTNINDNSNKFYQISEYESKVKDGFLKLLDAVSTLAMLIPGAGALISGALKAVGAAIRVVLSVVLKVVGGLGRVMAGAAKGVAGAGRVAFANTRRVILQAGKMFRVKRPLTKGPVKGGGKGSKPSKQGGNSCKMPGRANPASVGAFSRAGAAISQGFSRAAPYLATVSLVGGSVGLEVAQAMTETSSGTGAGMPGSLDVPNEKQWDDSTWANTCRGHSKAFKDLGLTDPRLMKLGDHLQGLMLSYKSDTGTYDLYNKDGTIVMSDVSVRTLATVVASAAALGSAVEPGTQAKTDTQLCADGGFLGVASVDFDPGAVEAFVDELVPVQGSVKQKTVYDLKFADNTDDKKVTTVAGHLCSTTGYNTFFPAAFSTCNVAGASGARDDTASIGAAQNLRDGEDCAVATNCSMKDDLEKPIAKVEPKMNDGTWLPDEVDRVGCVYDASYSPNP